MADSKNAENPIVETLRERLEAAGRILQRPDGPALGPLTMWSSQIRFALERIYGSDSPFLSGFPPKGFIDRTIADPRAEFQKREEALRRIIAALEAVPQAGTSQLLGKRVFIGHGRSLLWYQLKDFIRDRVGLPCDEFNLEPAAGMSTTERLESMLAQAGFAFVVMTAEEKHADGLVYARPNVIHEVGLFQGKLGTHRAIVLLESGCSDFSNITGLTQIRFPQGNIGACFEDEGHPNLVPD